MWCHDADFKTFLTGNFFSPSSSSFPPIHISSCLHSEECSSMDSWWRIWSRRLLFNLKLIRILMAWDLVQTNRIDSWTDMLVMKKEPFLASVGPNIYTLLHSNQLRWSTSLNVVGHHVELSPHRLWRTVPIQAYSELIIYIFPFCLCLAGYHSCCSSV